MPSKLREILAVILILPQYLDNLSSSRPLKRVRILLEPHWSFFLRMMRDSSQRVLRDLQTLKGSQRLLSPNMEDRQRRISREQ